MRWVYLTLKRPSPLLGMTENCISTHEAYTYLINVKLNTEMFCTVFPQAALEDVRAMPVIFDSW